ncbi:C40 family peptidase [Sphingobacterium corticis]|uniref:C40 family peptidase n=1 Tax=Sphingobacterium corticis TaxID=1812823 RepID=A0ABW5NHR6_9SPHI
MKVIQNVRKIGVTGLFLFASWGLTTKSDAASHTKGTGVDKIELSSKTDNNKDPDIISFAKKFLGVKYKYGQTSPSNGFDCSGFVYYVFKEFGINLPRSSSGMGQVGKGIETADAQAGDIILFTGTNPAKRQIGHVGIVTSNSLNSGLEFIHASSGKAQAVTETKLEGSYQKRFMKIVRVL